MEMNNNLRQPTRMKENMNEVRKKEQKNKKE